MFCRMSSSASHAVLSGQHGSRSSTKSIVARRERSLSPVRVYGAASSSSSKQKQHQQQQAQHSSPKQRARLHLGFTKPATAAAGTTSISPNKFQTYSGTKGHEMQRSASLSFLPTVKSPAAATTGSPNKSQIQAHDQATLVALARQVPRELRAQNFVRPHR
jgi:hypothetical protein